MNSRFLLGSVLMLAAAVAQAQGKPKSQEPRDGEPEAKEVSGMSIVGNNEAPKSLTIIPWKNSEIGQETQFSSQMLTQEMVPLDKATFQRELEFYRLSNPN